MSEMAGKYSVGEMAMTKTFSLTMTHIAKVADMAGRSGKSQGLIVREAIDLLYDLMAEDLEPGQMVIERVEELEKPEGAVGVPVWVVKITRPNSVPTYPHGESPLNPPLKRGEG